MTAHVRPVENPARPRRLESRDEILAWVDERDRVLSKLIEAEGLGRHRKRSDGPDGRSVQLEFEVAA